MLATFQQFNSHHTVLIRKGYANAWIPFRYISGLFGVKVTNQQQSFKGVSFASMFISEIVLLIFEQL